jgi:hypothetical protein
VQPDPAIAARLADMGFAPEQVAEALRATRNDEEAAVSVLLGEGGPRDGGGGGGGGGGGEGEEAEGPGAALLDNPVLRALLTHPGIQVCHCPRSLFFLADRFFFSQEGLRNPRVLEAFRAIMVDPGAARELLADPEVGPVLLQVNRVLRAGGEEEEDDDEHHNEE